MAYGCANFPMFALRPRNEYACVGAPPEKEVVPEPRRNGAVLAAIARVLREALTASAGPAHKGLIPELGGR
ncbi:MAG TPA: hypothetical protein VEY12_03210 [Thermoplasmata archaeon]|nr:hypothetical protein [Thermoplasmata archaeon]